MTTWVLIWIVSSYGIGTSASNESVAVATNSVVFHSLKACKEAAQVLNLRKHQQAYCFEDKQQ